MAYDDYFDKYKNEDIDPPKKKKGDYFAKYRTQGVDPSGPMQRVASAISTSLLGTDTGYGKSKYDKNINWFADIDERDVQGSINERRAEAQSGLTQAAAIIPRATTKALAEIAKIPGVVGGIISAPFAREGEGMDTAFNNAWIKTVDGIQEKINEDLMPIYTAKAVKEGNLWDNITSTSFWATDGADGIGFIVGMMAPGAAFEYLGLGSKLVKGLSNSQRLAKWSQMVGKAEEGTKLLKAIGASGKNIDSSLAIMGNTFLEAGAESKGVGDSLDQKKPEFIKQHTSQKMLELDQARALGTISEEDYTNAQKQINAEAEEVFKEQRALAMRNTFVANVAILLGPNAMMHKAIWGKAAQKFEKTTGGIKEFGKKAGKRFLQTAGSEGFWEEGSQTTVENMYVKKAMNAELGKENQSGKFIGDFTQEYANTLASTEGEKAIFLGAVLGSPISIVQGHKQDVANRKRTNAILDNIDSEITNFNDTFDNDIYKKDAAGDFIYKKDAEGNITNERVLDNKKVAKIAKSLNFTEQQSALFDLAVRTGNKDVVKKIKEQAIFNLILPAVHNGEAGLDALEQRISQDAKFDEVVNRDLTAEEKDNSKTFIKETLESARWLQAQKERFTDFSNDVIQLKDDRAEGRFKEDFLERLSASYLNSKYALRTAENDLKRLEKKRSDAFDEAGADQSYGLDPEFPTAKMKPGLVTNEDLEERATKTKSFLETNELVKQIDKEYQEKKAEIANLKKDISDIWKGSEEVNKAYQKFIDKEIGEERRTSPEAIAEAQELIDNIENAESREELDQLLLPPHIKEKTNKEYKKEFVDAAVNDARKRMKEDDSTNNLKSIFDKLSSLEVSSKKINKIIDEIESILEKRAEAQEVFKGELEELFDRQAGVSREYQKTMDDHQKKLDDLIAKQKFLEQELAKENKSPRGRYAKIIKELIADTQRELDKTNEEIKKQERILERYKEGQKSFEKELNYIFNRYNQVNKTEFESIQDIINYLDENAKRFKGHRQDLEKLLVNKFGTERRIEEVNENINHLENYKDILEELLEQYASMSGKIKPGTNMEDYKFLRDELIKTSKLLFNAKQELKEAEDKLSRLSKSIIDKSALEELNKESEFWNIIQRFKGTRVSYLARNPVIAEKIAEKEQQFEEKEIIEEEAEKEIHQNVEDDAKVNQPEEVPDPVVPEVLTDDQGEFEAESIPENEEEEHEDPVKNSDNMDESVSEQLEQSQDGAKVISTNMKTGEALHDNLKPFIEYERTPRDKSNDKVTFGLGDIAYYQTPVEEAYKRALDGKATAKDIALLEEQLPIKVLIEYPDKGKTKKVYSFIEAKTSAIIKDKDSLEMFETQTMPLRKNIVQALIANKGFDGISSNIVMQYPGLLKVDTKGQTTYEDRDGIQRVTNVPKNNIFDLQVFDGMTKEQKIKYFQENTGFINWEGRMMSTINDLKEIGPMMGEWSRGEVFLRIPQNNGTPFWIKLNVNKVSEEKAEAVYEMVAALSDVAQTIGKKTSFAAMTIDQFFTNLEASDPVKSKRIQKTLSKEIALVKKFNKGDKRNESLSRFLNLIIHHRSENPRTGFKLNKDGSLNLGSLANILMEDYDFTHKLTITKNELQTPEAKDVVTRFVQYKRHNILITRDGPGQFVFRNPAYVEYLMSELLSTNAVVNQPTFQGYSNIYLNQQVTNNKKAGQVKEVINDKDWNEFVDNNKVDPAILSSIAYKVKDKGTLSPREVAIFQARTSDIEDLIKQMSKEVIAKPAEKDKEDIRSFEFTFEKKSEKGGGAFSQRIFITTEESKITKGKKIKEAKVIMNSYAQLPNSLDNFSKEYPESVSDEEIMKEIIEKFKNEDSISKVYEGFKQKSGRVESKKTKSDEIQKEVEVETNEAGENIAMKNKFAAMRAKKAAPQSKEDVKTDVNEMKEIFKKADDDTKADMIINLADDFGMIDDYTSDEGAKKLEPKNLSKTFDELLNVAKQKNKSIDEIKKICGI